jgi:uncharacterized membrane protein YbhN (UPF0104 family)
MSPPEAPPPAPRGKVWQKLLLSLLPLAVVIWIMRSGSLRLMPGSEDLARVARWVLPAYLGLFAVMYSVRLSRWYFLLAAVERVPFWTVVRVGAVGLFAIAVLPFRMGEVVRPLLIRRGPKLTFWAASGTVGGERILDGFCVSTLLLGGLFLAKPLANLPDHIGKLAINVALIPSGAMFFGLLFASACVVMGVFYFWRAWARRVTELVVGVVSLRFARWIAAKIEQMAEGLGFLSNPRHALPYLGLTVVYWLLNGATFWVLAVACGLDKIGYFEALAIMGVVAVGITAPATPGFFGPFQFAIYAGLAMYLPPEVVTGAGAVYAFLGYLLPIGLTSLIGVVAILTKPRALLLLTSAPGAPEPTPGASAELPVPGAQP